MNLTTFAVVLVLPVLAIPAFLTGSVDRDLVTATLIGLGVLVLLVAAAITLLAFDEPLEWVGRKVQAARNAMRRGAEPLRTLLDRLIRERDRLLAILGPRAAPSPGPSPAGRSTTPRWSPRRAVGATPSPFLVLLAFCAAQVLAQVPFTRAGSGSSRPGSRQPSRSRASAPGRPRRDARLPARLAATPLPVGLAAYAAHRRRIAINSPA